jgi:hypothetical protein
VLSELVIVFSMTGMAPAAANFEAAASMQQNASTLNSTTYTAPTPTFSTPVAFDTSPALRDLAPAAARRTQAQQERAAELTEIRPDRGPTVADQGYSGDGALQADSSLRMQEAAPRSLATMANFEGLSNLDNFNIFGGRVNPPDPVGDVGPNHYVEMINLVFGVYSKTGTLLLGPVDTGTLWAGFPIDECTEPSGDPIVVYDQFTDRWLLTQFTTRGLGYPDEPLNLFYNCVAVSTTGDPTGSYYRYAFTTGYNFPDYPKYGVWRGSYIITTREFGILDPEVYAIGVYALEQKKMARGDPNARMVSFVLDYRDVGLELIGDGLLPPDIDGRRLPNGTAPAPIIGTQDDGGGYGATFDALNIWELSVIWSNTPMASLGFAGQLPTAAFDSIFPCAVVPGVFAPADARDCLPQPGITDGSQYLDILSYRQRPTWRLAYRNFGNYEALVTNQSVEALPGVAGARWYEIRRTGGAYSIHQQGTYAPNDGVHRWMGSIAMDKRGNMALGYSVVNGVDVYPGIRYTGRLAHDPAGQMTLGEGVIMNGSGVQTTTNSRWGDYTSMNIDPTDDCTFWYVNEYYEVSGVPLPLPAPPLPPPGTTAPWQTRIASFKLPGC